MCSISSSLVSVSTDKNISFFKKYRCMLIMIMSIGSMSYAWIGSMSYAWIGSMSYAWIGSMSYAWIGSMSYAWIGEIQVVGEFLGGNTTTTQRRGASSDEDLTYILPC